MPKDNNANPIRTSFDHDKQHQGVTGSRSFDHSANGQSLENITGPMDKGFDHDRMHQSEPVQPATPDQTPNSAFDALMSQDRSEG